MTQQERIIELMSELGGLTIKEINEHTGYHRSAIRNTLQEGYKKEIFAIGEHGKYMLPIK